MTKFEEKLEILPIKTIQHPVGDTKYYAAVHVKTLIAQADEEIANLKSQLQQQALPVVPDFIGKLINTFGAPEDGKYINYSASYLEIQKELDWIDNHQKTWLTALLIGFTVEKPQLFYLRDELTGQFLAKDNQFKNDDRYFFWTGADPLTHSIGTAWKLTFTQQEIDSMQTGSYELVPVEDGE
ncbi:Predicted prefoldin, molecular chaperone implicated in de novo protein folding [Lactococcus lactis]|uniref:Predicted prefoldin, molecular chaperone implicated in de novo protein folding n=2 Tax=Lactococcus lactis TaxID=1358 RepID=A0A2X0R4D5_9LACT|nr:Predicted prefoldin, molecular chaperone implicated in de novo protein folding [Lactococcus lactis]SPS11876.1 Predicted prefoldin, molecular chaperone implicated in de novo protein folding [Lactococcus lactis]